LPTSRHGARLTQRIGDPLATQRCTHEAIRPMPRVERLAAWDNRPSGQVGAVLLELVRLGEPWISFWSSTWYHPVASGGDGHARIAPFLDVDQGHLQGQPPVPETRGQN